MTNLAKNPTDDVEEICMRRELSGAGRTESRGCTPAARFGEEIIQLVDMKPADRVQQRAVQRVEISLRYMLENLNQPVKVPVLSAMVGLSESSFFALFKSATGLTPLDFFIRARMRRAGELLEDTALQIKEVAAKLGYDDQFYFSRLFKAVHGVPPREYRARKEKLQSQKTAGLAAGPATNQSQFSAARETSDRVSVLIGGFQPEAHFPKNYHTKAAGALLPASACSVSVPQ